MSSFSVVVLGSNSAIPAYGRNPSAQVVGHICEDILVDCGEGTQMRMNQMRIRRNRIKRILISHLHGDHYYGLIGLITSLNLLGRTAPLDIWSPPGLQKLMEGMLQLYDYQKLGFELNFHELVLTEKRELFRTPDLIVQAFPLVHRVPTYGFMFQEVSRLRKMRKSAIGDYDIPIEAIPGIKQGDDFELPDGTKISNIDLTFEPKPERSYAYCSDTVFSKETANYVRNVDVLYHEATFMEEQAERAEQTFHSTAKQAGRVAQMANAKVLLLGHFSSRYKNLEPLLNECKSVFNEAYLAHDKTKFEIDEVLSAEGSPTTA